MENVTGVELSLIEAFDTELQKKMWMVACWKQFTNGTIFLFVPLEKGKFTYDTFEEADQERERLNQQITFDHSQWSVKLNIDLADLTKESEPN